MEDHSERIQDYLEGQMDGDDLLHFEAQMAIDDDLRNYVFIQREVHAILNNQMNSDELILREQQDDAKMMFLNASSQRRTFWKLSIFGIVAVLILLFGTILFFGNRTLYDLPALKPEIFRLRSNRIIYDEAIKAYSNKSYQEARTLFAHLVITEPEEIGYKYYYALSYMGTGEWEFAIYDLKPIADGNSSFKDEAKYYLAIAYYRQGKVLNAVNELDKINAPSDLVEKANQLKSNWD